LPSRNTLSLSAATIAGIFSGTITRWNDPAIVKDNNRKYDKIVYKKDRNGNPVLDAKGNPVVATKIATSTRYTLPNKPIKVIYRSDSSGTTENFTNYLNKSAPTIWTKAKAAVFTSSFPGNINAPENLGRIVGASSSTGVSQLAGKTPYSVTFAEVNYAVANKLKVAHVINPAGNAVEPNSVNTSAFLAQAEMNANGIMTFDYATQEAGAYPLGIVSYMLADTSYPDKNKGAAVKSLANFLLSPACAKDKGANLGFSVIDGDFLKKAQSLVAKIG
jgi:phosphate transport system substrate-binding protein